MLIEDLKNDRDFTLFLFVGVFTGIAGGIYSTTFNNFLSDVFSLSADARGLVEFPRELPGMTIMFVIALLSFLGDIKMAVVGMIFAAIGLFGLGTMSHSFTVALAWVMIFSLGTHMFFPLTPSIGMHLSRKEQYGVRLGRYNAYNLFATILGYSIVWCGFKYLGLTYQVAFIIASLFYVIAALVLGRMKPIEPKKFKIKFILRKRYTLFYLLSLVNGARKQIFLTFAPWVLIQVFHVTPPVFAMLGLFIAAVSIMTRTIVGNAIDRLGERFVLSAEAILLVVICFGYAFAEDIAPAGIAVIILSACYIIDNSMNAVEMARSTYVRKIVVNPEDVTSVLAAGISFDHVIAMTIPFAGGILWITYGYKAVFLAAACIGLLNFLLSMRIRIMHDVS
jgi:hypothetical protein